MRRLEADGHIFEGGRVEKKMEGRRGRRTRKRTRRSKTEGNKMDAQVI
jgi:hypothetical protein